MKPKNATAKVQLLGQYDPEGERIIEDPYYVGTLLAVMNSTVREHPSKQVLFKLNESF